jgi:ribosomal protein S18 acetylase RimI-like enzyme
MHAWQQPAEPPEDIETVKVRVRAATPADAEAVAGMAQAFSVADGGRPSRLSAEAFRRDGFGARAAFTALIAEVDGHVAGYALFYPGYDSDGATRGVYLADLYVRAELRRQGVGRALVATVAAYSRRDGARWMFWSVLKRNKGARRFYRTVAPELRDVIVCAAFGDSFDRLADEAKAPRSVKHPD